MTPLGAVSGGERPGNQGLPTARGGGWPVMLAVKQGGMPYSLAGKRVWREGNPALP
jgi:hypothetical protein